jgi:hypothetical protein
MIAPAKKKKNAPGKGTNPSGRAREVKGRSPPIKTTRIVVIISGMLGRLLHGGPAVRITNSTRVCVARDSTNHPV